MIDAPTPRGEKPSRHVPRRSAASWRYAVALCAAVLLVAGVAAGMRGNGTTRKSEPVVFPARKIDYIHELVINGTVESGNNRDVACEFEWQSGWSPRIVEVIEEGVYVEPGDTLLRLDSSGLEDLIRAQQARCEDYEALVVKAESRLAVGELRLREYEEGNRHLAEKKAETNLRLAQDRLRRAERNHEAATALYRRGYITTTQLDAEAFALQSAQNELEAAQIALDVLARYTNEKTQKQLESEIAAAEASLQSLRRIAMIAQRRLDDLRKQLDKCIIRAPASGFVVLNHLDHGDHWHWVRVGEPVIPRMIVVRLPDPNHMQVVARINESQIAFVKKGLPASIRFDSMPGVLLTGTVINVNEFPEEISRHGPAVKDFKTTIEIDPESVRRGGCVLRPGLTAEVAILIEQTGPRVQIPMQAVLREGEKRYCLTYDQGELRALPIKTGTNNGQYVVVESGLEAGSRVVLAANLYRDKALWTEALADETDPCEMESIFGMLGEPDLDDHLPLADPSVAPLAATPTVNLASH